MFVYCLNNPVVFYDIGGYFAGVASVVPAVPAVAEFIVASVSNIWNPAGWIALGVTVGVAQGTVLCAIMLFLSH